MASKNPSVRTATMPRRLRKAKRILCTASLLALLCGLLAGCSADSVLRLLSIDTDTYDPATEMIADIADKTVEKTDCVSGAYVYTLYTDGTAAITKYTDTDTDAGGLVLTLPDTLDGHSVVALENKAFYKLKINTIVFPASIAYIGNYACMSCEGLQKIVFEGTPQSIGVSAFESSFDPDKKTKDDKGKEISTPGAALEIVWNGAPDVIREKAFYNCVRLREIVIPAGCREIGAWAFAKCYDADKILLGEGLAEIGDHAFLKCRAAKSVSIPGTCKTVGISAFYQCVSLTELTLGEGVETLQKGAFEECLALANVTLPASLQTIEKYAFYNCPYLDVRL